MPVCDKSTVNRRAACSLHYICVRCVRLYAELRRPRDQVATGTDV